MTFPKIRLIDVLETHDLYSYSYSYFIEFTRQTCMKKVHDNVHKRYSDKTMLTMKTNLLKIKQAPVNKGTFVGTGGTLG